MTDNDFEFHMFCGGHIGIEKLASMVTCNYDEQINQGAKVYAGMRTK